MDEHDVERLLRDAVGEAPPAGFSAGDVAARSVRETARFRMRVATAGAFTVLVLAGGGMVGFLGFGPPSETGTSADSSALSSGEADREQNLQSGQPGEMSARQERSAKDAGAAPLQGGAESADTLGCQEVDRELALALASELPATASRSPEAEPGRVPCADGGGTAAYRVDDGVAKGLISAGVVPSGLQFRLSAPEGRAYAEARTPSGGTLLVFSDPEGGSKAPLAGDLQRIADALAAGR